MTEVIINVRTQSRSWEHQVEREMSPGELLRAVNLLDTCWQEIRAGIVACMPDGAEDVPVVVFMGKEEVESFFAWRRSQAGSGEAEMCS